MADSEALLVSLGEALAVSLDPQAPLETKAVIEGQLAAFKASPGAWTHALYFLRVSDNDWILWFATSSLEYITLRAWEELDEAARTELRDALWGIVQKRGSRSPGQAPLPLFVFNKVLQVTVYIGIKEWARLWPGFVGDVAGLLKAQSPELGLAMLLPLSEEFVVGGLAGASSSLLPSAQKEAARMRFIAALPELLAVVTNLLNELAAAGVSGGPLGTGPPSLATYGLLAGQIASVDPAIGTRLQRTLEVVRSLFSWIPLSEILPPALLGSLAKLGALARPVGADALAAIADLISGSCVPAELEQFLSQIFDLIKTALAWVRTLGPAELADLDSEWTESLLALIDIFVRTHGPRLQVHPTFGFPDFCSSLFVFTFAWPDRPDHVTAALEIWSWLAEAWANGPPESEPRKLYQNGLLDLAATVARSMASPDFVAGLDTESGSGSGPGSESQLDEYLTVGGRLLTKIYSLYPGPGLSTFLPVWTAALTSARTLASPAVTINAEWATSVAASLAALTATTVGGPTYSTILDGLLTEVQSGIAASVWASGNPRAGSYLGVLLRAAGAALQPAVPFVRGPDRSTANALKDRALGLATAMVAKAAPSPGGPAPPPDSLLEATADFLTAWAGGSSPAFGPLDPDPSLNLASLVAGLSSLPTEAPTPGHIAVFKVVVGLLLAPDQGSGLPTAQDRIDLAVSLIQPLANAAQSQILSKTGQASPSLVGQMGLLAASLSAVGSLPLRTRSLVAGWLSPVLAAGLELLTPTGPAASLLAALDLYQAALTHTGRDLDGPTVESALKRALGLFDSGGGLDPAGPSYGPAVKSFLGMLDVIVSSHSTSSVFKASLPHIVSLLRSLAALVPSWTDPELVSAFHRLVYSLLLEKWRLWVPSRAALAGGVPDPGLASEHRSLLEIAFAGLSLIRHHDSLKICISGLAELGSVHKLWTWPHFVKVFKNRLLAHLLTLAGAAEAAMFVDRLIELLYQAVSPDFDSFYQILLPSYVTSLDGLTSDQATGLIDSVSPVRDLPTFDRQLNSLFRDIRFYQSINLVGS